MLQILWETRWRWSRPNNGFVPANTPPRSKRCTPAAQSCCWEQSIAPAKLARIPPAQAQNTPDLVLRSHFATRRLVDTSEAPGSGTDEETSSAGPQSGA